MDAMRSVFRIMASQSRRKTIALFSLLTVFAAPSAVHAADTATLTCTFDQGVVRSFENGAFATEAASKLSFRIGDVDFARQTAVLLTKKGRGELRVVRAINANHYLEVASEGFLNMTTIYDAAQAGAPMLAVHSRHLGVIGQPVVAQYTGSCVRTPSSQ